MKISIDWDLCQGHGVCESEAPEVFLVSKDGQLTVLDEAPDDRLRASLLAAVKYCPTHAISVEES